VKKLVAKIPCPLETTEVVVVKLPCPLEMTEVDVAELHLAQYEEMAVVELLVDQKEWQVHSPWVTTLVFDLTMHADFVAISTHLQKFCASTII
jgi:hypothetical protein